MKPAGKPGSGLRRLPDCQLLHHEARQVPLPVHRPRRPAQPKRQLQCLPQSRGSPGPPSSIRKARPRRPAESGQRLLWARGLDHRLPTCSSELETRVAGLRIRPRRNSHATPATAAESGPGSCSGQVRDAGRAIAQRQPR